jgi:hypothetical protein
MDSFAKQHEANVASREKKRLEKEQRHNRQSSKVKGDLRSQLIRKGLAPKLTPQDRALKLRDALTNMERGIEHRLKKQLRVKEQQSFLMLDEQIKDIASSYLDVLEKLIRHCRINKLGKPDITLPDRVRKEYDRQYRAKMKKKHSKTNKGEQHD